MNEEGKILSNFRKLFHCKPCLYFFQSDFLFLQLFLLFCKFKLFLLQFLFLILKLSHNGFNFIINRLFSLICWFFRNLSLLNGRLAFIYFASVLKLYLRHESSWLNKLNVVISAWTNIFVVHKSLNSDYPWPFFINISSTEIKLLIFGCKFESGRNHFFIFSQVAFEWLELFEVNYIGDLFIGFVGKCEKVVHSENDPALTPFFQELWAFV